MTNKAELIQRLRLILQDLEEEAEIPTGPTWLQITGALQDVISRLKSKQTLDLEVLGSLQTLYSMLVRKMESEQ